MVIPGLHTYSNSPGLLPLRPCSRPRPAAQAVWQSNDLGSCATAATGELRKGKIAGRGAAGTWIGARY